MGKSLNGKELGIGITQRKDGTYQARFVNRFGKRQAIYAHSYNEVQKKLREQKSLDDRQQNVANENITLDEWFEIWINTYKKNCRNNTKDTYKRHYKRVQTELGWRKLSQLNLIVMQNAINQLRTDNERKNSKKILSSLLENAVDSDLIVKNVAKKINTVVTQEKKEERRVLTVQETELFLEMSKNTYYHELFILALETGLRIGELTGLQISDIDLESEPALLHVRHSMTYFSKNGKYSFELHDTKTSSGARDIPLTKKAVEAIQSQILKKQSIVKRGVGAEMEFKDLLFVTRNNKPTTEFLIVECINGIVKRINKAYSDIEFKKVTPHAFRHTFATRYLERGIPIKTISTLMGHAKIQITIDLYCHSTMDSLIEGVKNYENGVEMV